MSQIWDLGLEIRELPYDTAPRAGFSPREAGSSMMAMGPHREA